MGKKIPKKKQKPVRRAGASTPKLQTDLVRQICHIGHTRFHTGFGLGLEKAEQNQEKINTSTPVKNSAT